MDIEVMAFDADDTLWHNELFFREAEEAFAGLLEDYVPRHVVLKELYHTEMQHLESYGYGIKAFMLSAIETALRISDQTIPAHVLTKILNVGQEMLAKPVQILPDVESVLAHFSKKYRLVLVTKGDLIDQERKLRISGLEPYFHHIEIVSEKKEPNYHRLITHLDIQPSQFLMIGNSLKSDCLPVIQLGGYAIHIPYHITWQHEHIETPIVHAQFHQMKSIQELLTSSWLKQ